MNKGDAFRFLKRRLGGMQSSNLDTAIHEELQFAQHNGLEGHIQLPWFLESEVATKPTVANEHRVPLPRSFIRECENDEGALWITNSQGDRIRELQKMSTGEMARRFHEPGTPAAYNVQGDYIVLGPEPDDKYELLFIFYQRDTPYSALADTATNKWLTQAADWLINEAGLGICGTITQYKDLAPVFENLRNVARQRVLMADTAQREANRERNKGRRRRRRGER